MQSDGSNSALSPVVHRDIAPSIHRHYIDSCFFPGKTFAASLPKGYEGTPKLFQITMKTNGGGGGGKNNSPQPLVGWSEVASHPGLVCAMTQSSNNPVILMVKPDTVQVQEIKVQPAKAKVSSNTSDPIYPENYMKFLLQEKYGSSVFLKKFSKMG